MADGPQGDQKYTQVVVNLPSDLVAELQKLAANARTMNATDIITDALRTRVKMPDGGTIKTAGGEDIPIAAIK